MARTPLLAGLLLTAMLAVPGAAASHDDPDCRFTSTSEEVMHVGCIVDVAMQDGLDAAERLVDETVDYVTTVACIVADLAGLEPRFCS